MYDVFEAFREQRGYKIMSKEHTHIERAVRSSWAWDRGWGGFENSTSLRTLSSGY
jgi:hypothetical protein